MWCSIWYKSVVLLKLKWTSGVLERTKTLSFPTTMFRGVDWLI